MTRMMAGLVGILAVCTVLGATDAQAQRRGSRRAEGNTGKVVFRGGVALDGSRTINLGGERAETPEIALALSPGVGYYFAPNASIDFDVTGSAQVSPAFAFEQLGATPGVRYEFGNFYARTGVPLVVFKQFGLGALAGAGMLIPMGESTKSVLGVDYTYWLSPVFRRASPYGKIELKLGVQQSF